MENEELTREAKIASPTRVDKANELLKKANNTEKETYYQGVSDYWEERGEGQKRIREIQELNKLMSNYTKEELLQISDTMIQVSNNSGEILGYILERKIVNIEGNLVTVAIKTKDIEGIMRVYKMDLDFDKMKNIIFSKEAKIASPMRSGSAVEVKNIGGNDKKEEYFNAIPNFWDKNVEQNEQQK